MKKYRDNYEVATPCKNCKKSCKVRFHPSLVSAMTYCKKQEEIKCK